MAIQNIHTSRLILIPFTLNVARTLLDGDISILVQLGLQPTLYWPDQEAIDTLPKIIKNLELVSAPTGFESWMVVHKYSMAVIGDAGFKGMPNADGEVDIGYAIIAQEQQKGYGMEVAKGLLDWAFSQPNVAAVTARCLISNTSSARILEKLGMQEDFRTQEMIYWRVANPNLVATLER